MIKLATETLGLIDAAIDKDQGAEFRQRLETILPKMEDAYRGEGSPFRSHLGISLIGKDCARDLWYGWNWAKRASFPPRIHRLFNRGHLEEARFIAMLETAGFEVWYETADGGQFRVSEIGGHLGSALDGVVQGIPELPQNEPAYAEFKTHNDKSFKKLKKEGVASAMPSHFTQMQMCMGKMQLSFGLYLAVNKNDDELYGEIIEFNYSVEKQFTARASMIITAAEPPPKISASPTWFQCKFCNHADLCHGDAMPEVNCRTCYHSSPILTGGWKCAKDRPEIATKAAFEGCQHHLVNPNLINGAEVITFNFDSNLLELKLQNGSIIKTSPNFVTSKELCSSEIINKAP